MFNSQTDITALRRRSAPPGRPEVIQQLRGRLQQFAVHLEDQEQQVLSTGIPALDALFPDGGLRSGMLSEWIAAESGCGALSLAMRVAGQAQSSGPLILIDRQQTLYPPAFAAAGVALAQTILVHPNSHAEELWALEQSLRCPGVGAVLCSLDHLRISGFRRLQLAAESGTAIGFLIRPATATRQTGWADIRLLVTPEPSPRLLPHTSSFHRTLNVQCLYARGKLIDQNVRLEICDETNSVRVAAELPHSASASGKARA